MRTRGQLKREEQVSKPKPQKTSEPKKTKKELLEEKNKRTNQALAGSGQGKKKLKKQAKPQAQTRRGKQQTIRVSNEHNNRSKKQDVSAQAKSKKRKADSPQPQKDKLSAKTRKNPKQDDKKQSGKVNLKDKEQNAKQIKTIQFKGKVPIDEHCDMKSSSNHVLEYEGKVYSSTLNQTSISDNNNKFYIIQVIQTDANPSHCYFFTRWGRVGVKGQSSIIGPLPINAAIRQFNQKFHAKNKKGDYRQIELNYEQEDDKQQQKKDDGVSNVNAADKKQKDLQKSKLPTSVKNLIDLIFDLKMMNKHMISIGYNIKKMPLGKLSKDNIMRGYKILQELMEVLKGKHSADKISELSSDFYSIIPHDFGFQKMINFNLDDEKKVKAKIQLLEALAQIKIATVLLSNSNESDNQFDSNYKKLNRDIHPVEKRTQEFQLINKYLQSTHATTHTAYQLELADLFSLSSEVQNIRYTKHIHNKTLLWHGSRLTNFVGILSQGLRIAPPQAPVTGYMFGKGVYFADMSSKSANYCFTSRQDSTGILLLCEVALGEMNEKMHADFYASNLPPGKHSTKGMGRTAPDPSNAAKLDDGVIVPMGPGQPTNIGCTLLYNEFIVYDIAQIKVRYLLRTKFNYK